MSVKNTNCAKNYEKFKFNNFHDNDTVFEESKNVIPHVQRHGSNLIGNGNFNYAFQVLFFCKLTFCISRCHLKSLINLFLTHA